MGEILGIVQGNCQSQQTVGDWVSANSLKTWKNYLKRANFCVFSWHNIARLGENQKEMRLEGGATSVSKCGQN